VRRVPYAGRSERSRSVEHGGRGATRTGHAHIHRHMPVMHQRTAQEKSGPEPERAQTAVTICGRRSYALVLYLKAARAALGPKVRLHIVLFVRQKVVRV
jgi:hypothetical protein